MENKEMLDTEEPLKTKQPNSNTNQSAVEDGEAINDLADMLMGESLAVEVEEKIEVTSNDETKELRDKYLRLYADFENFRRRTAKEKLELVSTASEGLLVALLPVLDDFERALKSVESTSEIDALKEGIQLIFNKFYKVMESKGLKPMESQGQPFNADFHESITQFPAPSEDLKGKVIEEVEKGYLLNDKVIRFAKVVVGA